MAARSDATQQKFGELLRLHRKRRGLTLTELAGTCKTDDGNLLRIERGERKPPKLPVILGLLKALAVQPDSTEWQEILSAAARERFEAIHHAGVTYLQYENTLQGLPPNAESPRPHTVSLTEAALEIGKLSASSGVKKITVEALDGTEIFFYIQEPEPGE